jgi:polyisoprenoid-binding protein YceI
VSAGGTSAPRPVARRRGDLVSEARLALGSIVLVAGLAGCVTRPTAPGPSGRAQATARAAPSPHLGQPFGVAPSDSLLVVLVYRAGALAAFGHNHVVSCRCIRGEIYVPGDPAQASFDLRIPVGQLTVDDPAMRAAEHSPDFPPDVSESAQQAVRHNMLTAAVLNAAQFPDIALRAEGLHSSAGKPGEVVARVLIRLRGESRSIAVPVHYDLRANEVVASGEFALEQTDLGLTPFSTLGGALSVRNSMTVRFRLVARRGS